MLKKELEALNSVMRSRVEFAKHKEEVKVYDRSILKLKEDFKGHTKLDEKKCLSLNDKRRPGQDVLCSEL